MTQLAPSPNRLALLWTLLVLAVTIVGNPTYSLAGELKVSGFTAADLRWFPQSPRFEGQFSGMDSSVLIEPEFRYRMDDGGPQFTFIPFGRLSSRDAKRSHFDIREAYIAQSLGDWDYLVGINKVFWGVAESRHLVNIINQTDAIEDTDDEDKLGQPMINIGVQKDWGRIDLFVLPGFRERTFSGSTGRLRSGLTVNEDQATFESGAKNAHVDFAGRYSHVFGNWDVGVSMFHGLSREARFLVGADGRLAPHYDLITQFGLDVQYTFDAWLWKFEGIAREGHGKPFAAMVGGLEYTFYQVSGRAADIGVLSELHLDGRDEDETPGTVFDNDIFMGIRLALNDVDDTQALAGTVIDSEDGTLSFLVEAKRRIGSSWKIEAEGRILTNVSDNNALSPFRRDSFFNLRLARYF
jgi:hypothetical protein